STNPVPYLYFSANNRKNGYTPGYAISLKDATYPATGKNVIVQAYVQSAGSVVNPGPPVIYGPPVVYWSPDTFQIICAGSDGKFGPGGLWGVNNPAPLVGQDDIGSFNKNHVLAAPQ